MNAYTHGYQTLVVINAFGEAHLEFFMVNLILFFGMVVVFDMLREGHKEQAECPFCHCVFRFTKDENVTFVMCPRCGMIGVI